MAPPYFNLKFSAFALVLLQFLNFGFCLNMGELTKKKIYIKTLKANPALPTYKEYFLCCSPNFNLKFSAFALVLLQFLDFGFCLNMGEITKNKKITPKLRYFFFVWLPPLQSKVFCFCFSFTSISSFFLLLKYGGANKKKDLYKNLTYLFITTYLFDYN